MLKTVKTKNTRPERFTHQQYTGICFWKHLRWEILDARTELWFIFDQRCLVLQFDQSSRVSRAVIDSHSVRRVICCSSFRRGDMLQMPTVRQRSESFFTDYPPHAGWSDSFSKYDKKLFSVEVTNWTFTFSVSVGAQGGGVQKDNHLRHLHVQLFLLVQCVCNI